MGALKLCFVLFVASAFIEGFWARENCEKCIPKDMCDMFTKMGDGDQQRWIEEHPCRLPEEKDDQPPFGFSSSAKGDLVCCPYSNIWGVENPSQQKDNNHNRFGSKEDHAHKYDSDEHRHEGEISDDEDDDDFDGDNENVSLEKYRYRWNNRPRGPRPRPNNYGGYNTRPSGRNPERNQAITQGNFNTNPIQNQYNRPAPYPTYNQNGPINNGINQNGFGNRPVNNINTQVPSGNSNFGNQNGFNPSQTQQYQKCSLSILPPNPQSACCGLDVSSERTFGTQNNFMVRPRPSQSNFWGNQPRNRRRFIRATDKSDDVGITLDNRIAGGKQTDLYQYPWTVLLKSTFNYGDRKGTFNCGGSLISSRYVLTAAHCLKEENGALDSVDVYLAEYDKRTFPRDCVNSPEGRKCIENILTQAESVVVHPNYDDNKLANDIALVRLRENIPYSDFTRPVCLPPINIDNPEYSNLRLAVAGWGRNGSVPSEVKQSTVVNLVPQRECQRSYPQLSEKHVCAAGRNGEDTCKGDSGGPLMMLYQGQYYVSGVVSGKRMDAPCGTAVPSLYTNVYHFVPWISQNIRN